MWNKTPKEVIEEFLNSGIKSKIIVTQADKLDRSFIGKGLDRSTINLFLDAGNVCGENGEYHTLSYDGGPFKNTVDFSILNVIKLAYNIKLDNGEIKKYEYW